VSDRIREQLGELGLDKGDVVMVHASMRAVRCDVNEVVRALVDTAGTVVAYVDWEMESDDAVFDPKTARATRDHGILAETIRAWPGAIRSAHPDAGVSAIGERAAWLTEKHPLQYGYGEGSPLHKLVLARGKVLMLGAPLDTVTLLHFSEHVASVPDKRVTHYERRMASGETVRFEEFETSEPVSEVFPKDHFGRIAVDFLETGRGRVGHVGSATAHVFDAPELHDFAVAWLEKHAR
jgi:aminoglycoside 3-N-acetyltransferase